MLVADIIRRVRDAAGDVSVLQFSQPTLVDWINDAVRECVIENSLLQAKATNNTVIGTADYVLPSDIFKLHSVYADGYKLTVQTLEEWEQLNSNGRGSPVDTGDAYVCYVFAGVLTIYPVPDRVFSLVINYTKLPPAITYAAGPPEVFNPTTPAIPEAFHNHIVAYCLAQVALQDDDVNRYAMLMQQFKSNVIDLKSLSNPEDLYSFISVSPRDSGDYYG